MRILGIHIGHDATAALMDEHGNVMAAMGEERLSRVKNHYAFPYRSIKKVRLRT